MKQRKILMVLMGLEIGGAETHVVGLASSLEKLGWEVQVASAGGVYEQELQRLGIRHFYAPVNTKNPVAVLRSRKILERIILQEKPDIVHAHARIPAVICGSLHKKYGFPFVTTAHWTFVVNPVLKCLTNWGQQTLAVSEDIRDYLIESYSLPAGQIHITVNGIDSEQFSPEVSGRSIREEFEIPQEAPVVTCVTRLHDSRAKSALELAELAPVLAEKIPGIRIMITGDGQQLESLKNTAAAVNRRQGYSCLILTGARRDIAEIIRAGDLFVGVSRAALEAMSCGVPVILCGNEGHGGLVCPENAERYRATNYCCRDYPESTPERLLTDILSVFRMSEAQRRAVGMAGREIILKDFSLLTMAADCMRVYELVMSENCGAWYRPKAVLSGYYGYDNIGDDMILQHISSRYRENCSLTALSRNPDDTTQRYGIAAVPRFSPVAVVRAIKGSDLLVSGGGSLLQNRTSLRSLWYYLWVIRTAEHYHKRIMIYANGVGPITGRLSRRLTGNVLSGAELITVRDADSRRELKNLGVRGEITLAADPVLCMEKPDKALGLHLLIASGVPVQDGKPILGISLRSAGMTKKGAACTAQLFDRICSENDCIPVFLCMQQSTDEEATVLVMQQMKTTSFLMKRCTTGDQMAAVIANMAAVVSMRFHLLVFAAVSGVPMAGFDYDLKLRSVLAELNMPVLPMPEQLDPDAAAATVSSLFQNPELKNRLSENTERLRVLADENDRLLDRMLEPENLHRRVLHIIGGGDTGGAKTHVISILKGLVEQGYQVQLVCFIEGAFSKEAMENGIPTIVLQKNSLGRNVRWLRRYIRTHRPAVVHCHGAKANMYGVLLQSRSRGAFRLVTTVHSDPALDYLGRPTADLVFGNINRAALKRIPNKICVSESVSEVLKEQRLCSGESFIMHNGVSFAKPEPEVAREEYLGALGIRPEADTVVFGTAARLSPVKDLATMIRAFAEAVTRHPGAYLLIAGNGEEEEKLKKLALEVCPEGSVVFVGWIKDTDSFFGAIDVNVLSSLSEGLPYAIPEGGRRKCATIATRVGGIPSIIEDGETGLLFEPGDVQRLTELMCRMIEAPEERHRLAEGLYNRTCREFSLEGNIRRQMEIYDTLCKE